MRPIASLSQLDDVMIVEVKHLNSHVRHHETIMDNRCVHFPFTNQIEGGGIIVPTDDPHLSSLVDSSNCSRDPHRARCVSSQHSVNVQVGNEKIAACLRPHFVIAIIIDNANYVDIWVSFLDTIFEPLGSLITDINTCLLYTSDAADE